MDGPPIQLDTVIFGGGAAGLWLLDELCRRGHEAILLEAGDLGSDQTIGSQGIIHGGLKYTLSGRLTAGAKSIRDMPQRWRASLAGEQGPALQATRLRSDFCYLWRTDALRSRIAMIGARAGLRVAPTKLADHERPAVLELCPGTVARVNEQVIEPVSMMHELAKLHRQRVLRIDFPARTEFQMSPAGNITEIRLGATAPDREIALQPRAVVFTAGAGNAALREAVGLPANAMQRRPLHMAMVRGSLPELNGHCVDGAATRLTITSTRDSADRVVWQLGGQLAEKGVTLEPEDLIDMARTEVRAVLPEILLTETEWATYRVDRAEGAAGGRRPESFTILRDGNTMTVWPTKLALIPIMADAIAEELGEPAVAPLDLGALRSWPQPVVAIAPWETTTRWHADAWDEPS